MIFGQKKQIPVIRVDKAKEILLDGLSSYIDGNPEWLPEYDGIVDWLTYNKGKGLLAIGDAGRGKTVICVDILSEILNHLGISYHIVSSYNMSREKDLYDSSVLIVDDIGIEDKASFFGERHELFAEIVDQAERRGIMLVITSNLDNKELFERYGKRVFDRLSKLVKPVCFKGDSLRGKESKQFYYAYNVRFGTEEEADKFASEQIKIRKGIQNGTIVLFDDLASEAFEMNEALVEENKVAYKYGEKSDD